MDQSKIYVVTPQQKYTYAEGMSHHEKYDYNQYEVCPKCGARISGAKQIGEKIYTVGKKKLPDFMYIHGGTDLPFIVSEKAYYVLKEKGIRGITGAEKIDKIIRNNELIDDVYFDLSAIRCSYPIDYERSKIAFGDRDPQRKKCDFCNPEGRISHFIFSLCFKPEVTVEEDIFTTYQTKGMLFLSERFIKTCEENRLTGLNRKPIHKYDSAQGIFSEEEVAQMLKNNK